MWVAAATASTRSRAETLTTTTGLRLLSLFSRRRVHNNKSHHSSAKLAEREQGRRRTQETGLTRSRVHRLRLKVFRRPMSFACKRHIITTTSSFFSTSTAAVVHGVVHLLHRHGQPRRRDIGYVIPIFISRDYGLCSHSHRSDILDFN